jgi:mannose-6-phosphate isomerase-like protein (cupin superfamily)
MLAASTPQLNLIETTMEGDKDHRVNVEFPVSAETGAAETAVVYFEIDPGYKLATHTDSAEEVLYIVEGQGEAHVGDETAHVTAGDLAVVPALAPHGIRNTGDTRLKVVGFFREAEVHSVFPEPLIPLGTARPVIGAAAAATA